MRGFPGSGKSYEARSLCQKYGGNPDDNIFSTDDFWVWEVLQDYRQAKLDPTCDHVYWQELLLDTYRANWTAEKLGRAHNWNHQRFETAVGLDISPVVVDNTNVKARDIRGYVQTAEEAGYEIQIHEPNSPWWLDHRAMLEAKQANGTALENFARFLAGFHEGMSAKYGVKGNTHGCPLDTIRNMIRRWQPNLTVEDIMGRNPEFSGF